MMMEIFLEALIQNKELRLKIPAILHEETKIRFHLMSSKIIEIN